MVPYRVAAALLLVALLSACGGAAAPTTTRPTAPVDPTPVLGGATPPTANAIDLDSSARAFVDHVREAIVLAADEARFTREDIEKGYVDLLSMHGEILQSWAETELEWVAANPPTACYRDAYDSYRAAVTSTLKVGSTMAQMSETPTAKQVVAMGDRMATASTDLDLVAAALSALLSRGCNR